MNAGSARERLRSKAGQQGTPLVRWPRRAGGSEHAQQRDVRSTARD